MPAEERSGDPPEGDQAGWVERSETELIDHEGFAHAQPIPQPISEDVISGAAQ
jgi:hypothetical protein